MPATRAEIERWLDPLYREGEDITHMIVKCDDFDHGAGRKCCYPVYVYEHENVRDAEKEHGDRTMEVYSRNHSREEQMQASRAFNYD